MEQHRQGNTLADLLVPPVWILGAVASSFLGVGVHPLAGAGALVATLIAALLLARLSVGWRAVPAVFFALALQTPALVAVGFHVFSMPLDMPARLRFLYLGFGSPALPAILAALVAATPIGFLLRLERRGLDRLRRLGIVAAPLTTLVAVGLVGLGATRLARFPTPERYVDSLPLHAKVSRPEGQPCERVQDITDPKHDPGHDWSECATPEVEAAPLSLHFHCPDRSGTPDYRYCSLHYRYEGGEDRYGAYVRSESRALTLRRDDLLDAWLFKQGSGKPTYIFDAEDNRYWVYLSDVRSRVAPPVEWTLMGGAGVLLAGFCALGWLGLRRLVDRRRDAGVEWLSQARGDLSLVAFATALCSSALLVASLLGGFLV